MLLLLQIVRILSSRLIGERENIQGVAACGMTKFRRQCRRNFPGAASTQPGSHRDVLFAVDAERHWEPLDGRPQPRLPQDGPTLRIECFELTIEIADKSNTPTG